MTALPKTALPLLLGLSASGLAAQNLLSYLPNGPAPASRLHETPCPSPAYALGGGGPGFAVGALPGPVRPLLGAPDGAVDVDNRTGIVYATNGAGFITRTPYPRLGLGAPGAPLPSLPIPAAVGNVTGLAVDPVSKNLFLTNGVTVFEVDPMAGMAILNSFPAAPVNILSGLDFDPALPGSVFGVSTAAEIIEYNRASGGLLGLVAPAFPVLGGMATGLARDKSAAVGGNSYVLFQNGDVIEFASGILHVAGLANHVGICYLASPVNLASGGVCGGTAARVRVGTLFPENMPGFSLDIGSIPAGPNPTVLLLGNALTAGVAVPGITGLLWTPPVVSVPMGPVAGATTLSFPAPLAAGTAGLRFFAQWGYLCAAAPGLGVVLSDAMQIEVSR